MLSFAFAAVMLGLCCRHRNKSAHHNVSLAASLEMMLHEGMPMLIYSQVLSWGQTCVCLALSICIALCGVRFPLYFPAMVPLGLEAESDIYPSQYPSGKYMWSQQVSDDVSVYGLCHVPCAVFRVPCSVCRVSRVACRVSRACSRASPVTRLQSTL